jgi:hypothetical protein
MRGLIGVLFTGVVALVAGAIGFQAGIASNIGAAGGAVYLGGGLPGLGFLFFLFFLFFVGFVLFAIGGRRRAWAHGPMGGPGRWGGNGPWSSDGDPRRQWVADAHRRLHEEESAAAGAAGAAGTTGTTGAAPEAPIATDRSAAG